MATANPKTSGKELNRNWKLGVAHALYRATGNWYHHLTDFPGALIDANGYVIFETEEEYRKHPGLQHGKELSVPRGISSLPEYRRNSDPRPIHGSGQSEEAEKVPREVADAPETMREALIQARLGQGQFRRDLVAYWGGCAVTGCSLLEALRASHIKPWRIASNRQRLDPYNGLLLLGTLDAMFDNGFISFSDSGQLIRSVHLNDDECELLGLRVGMRLRKIDAKHREYLQWHRKEVFVST